MLTLCSAKTALETFTSSVAEKATSGAKSPFLKELLEQKSAPAASGANVFRGLPSNDAGGDGTRGGDTKDDVQSEEEDDEGRRCENSTRIEEEKEHVERDRERGIKDKPEKCGPRRSEGCRERTLDETE